MEKETEINWTKIAIWGVVIIFGIIVFFNTLYTVQAGHRGVLLTFGKASMHEVGEGLNIKFPFVQRVIKIEVRTQKYEAEASAASKDLQIVTATIATNYHLIPSETSELYTNIGQEYRERVMMPMEQEVVKAITAKYAAEELITKREEVRLEIKELFIQRLQQRGIIVEEVSITNFDFSKSFNDAIESKVTAEQLKLKADRDLERIRIEAEQKITQARAEAESLRLQKEQITPEMLQLRAIEKWNGILPLVTGDSIPMINLNLTAK
jgi:regulator of protease activity HflC (stomatin/prohibitin superfamily)